MDHSKTRRKGLALPKRNKRRTAREWRMKKRKSVSGMEVRNEMVTGMNASRALKQRGRRSGSVIPLREDKRKKGRKKWKREDKRQRKRKEVASLAQRGTASVTRNECGTMLPPRRVLETRASHRENPRGGKSLEFKKQETEKGKKTKREKKE